MAISSLQTFGGNTPRNNDTLGSRSAFALSASSDADADVAVNNPNDNSNTNDMKTGNLNILFLFKCDLWSEGLRAYRAG
jgi:hypothetical protein